VDVLDSPLSVTKGGMFIFAGDIGTIVDQESFGFEGRSILIECFAAAHCDSVDPYDGAFWNAVSDDSLMLCRNMWLNFALLAGLLDRGRTYRSVR
jgi:hypothetical protein